MALRSYSSELVNGRRCCSAVAPSSAQIRSSSGLRGSRRSVSTVAMMDFFKKFFDFKSDKFMPKSTRIWRLQQYEYPGGSDTDEAAPNQPPSASDMVNDLEAHVNSVPASSRPTADPDDMPTTSGRPDSTGVGRKGGANSSSSMSRDGGSIDVTASFSDAGDSDLAAALRDRVSQLSSTDDDLTADVEVVQEVPPLTGAELRKLIFSKYGKSFDMSFVRRDIPGKTIVALNIMWTHLEQRSFQMTAEQYDEKLDGIAYRVNVLGQTSVVRSFLLTPARSVKGLPRRPVVGTAISIRFDLPQNVIDEWFSY